VNTPDGEPIAPATAGAIGELRVCADLMERGFEVFRALSQARHSCDIVALRNGLMLRIEVRTGTQRTPSTGYVSYMKNRSLRTYSDRPSYAQEPDHYAVMWQGELIRYDPELPM